jgi:CheY-like chemotaxis protein
MTQPLALVLYEKILPGSQLVNRLQDIKYRVQTLTDAATLLESAEQAKPLVVLADLESSRNNVCAAIAQLKAHPATKHLPVIGFFGEKTQSLQAEAQAAGATLVVHESAILDYLPQFLEQALQVE